MAENSSVQATKPSEPKPSLISRISRFFRDMKGEIKKVVWPTRKQLINNTIVVIVMIVLAAIFIGLFDALLGWVLQLRYTLLG